MNSELKKIIGGENKKNPLTDEEIAEKMNLSREMITVMRKENNIPSSKERMKPLLKKEIKKVIADKPDISIRQLTKIFQEKGFQVSRHIMRNEYNKLSQKNDKTNNKTAGSDIEKNNYSFNQQFISEKKESFAEIIGADLSLKTQIQQAKAAVLYPPHGLHTLIIGESGVGKSFLAEQMYNFAEAKKEIKEDRFVIFNCADYAENPQLLYSYLFGHKKGSFTGAEKDKDGLIKKADNGILFLDEVHRLSSEGQEMLFNVIDNGFYRKLGETERKEKIDLMIIAATTEDIKSNLLATFRRRIPLIIDLPPLNKRTLEEKLKFIKLFIARESRQINQKITLKYEAARALISFDPENNIGELESKIKEICARAYLNFISGKEKRVKITIDLLDLNIQRSFFEGSIKREDIKKLIKDDIILSPEVEPVKSEIDFKKTYKLDNDIYKYLEEKNKELYSLGFDKNEINKKLNQLLAEKVNSVFNQAENSFLGNEEILVEIVDSQIIDMINDVLVIVHRELPELVLNQRLKYALAIHLDAVIERIKSGKIIKHPDLQEVKNSHHKLYKISKKIVEYLNKEYALQIPEDEIGYITMYLDSVSKNKDIDKAISRVKPGIIVLSHGAVASEMLKVSNWLLGNSDVIAIDMLLDQPPNLILKKLINVAQDLDQGKGILLLVDMGSLKSFGKIITEKTGIKTRVISRVDTVMLMEAIRWSKYDNLELEELANRITKSANSYSEREEKAILIYCITGQGAALKIKDYLYHRLANLEDEFKIITTGLHDKDINQYIDKISSKYDLQAVIGNLKPDLNDNYYYSFEDILSDKGFANFVKNLNLQKADQKDYDSEKLLDKNLIYLNPKIKSKEEVLEFLSKKMFSAGVVKDSYYQAVVEKENHGVTYVGNGIAIPHAESKYVNYSQFALAVLNKPIDWAGFEVDVICMFAFKDLKTDHFRIFYNKLKENLNYIKNAEDIEHIKEVFVDG
jgi:transcriptional regulator with AAA-type ATPase domain/transcriptional regulatory protein LevR